MISALDNALVFVISTLFDFYLTILIIRMVLAYVHADYFNPFTQFIAKMTDPVIKPLKKILPNTKGIEISSLALVLVFDLIKFFIILSLTFGMPSILGLFILVLGDILKLTLQVFFYAIILQALLSMIQPYSPLSRVLYNFTLPIMRPFQRVIPPVSGFDLSPIPALLSLQLLIMLLASPLMSFGMGMAFA